MIKFNIVSHENLTPMTQTPEDCIVNVFTSTEQTDLFSCKMSKLFDQDFDLLQVNIKSSPSFHISYDSISNSFILAGLMPTMAGIYLVNLEVTDGISTPQMLTLKVRVTFI